MNIIAYHGTSADCAHAISNSNFTASSRNTTWLGNGRYFFQEGLAHATAWANFIASKRQSTPAVFAAEIDLSECLDLADADNWSQMKAIFDQNRHSLSLLQQLSPVDVFSGNYNDPDLVGRNYVDHAFMQIVISYFLEKTEYQWPKVVRCPFMEGEPIHSSSWLFSNASIIVSVLDPNAILEVQQII